jgi:hypothetical protein
VLHDGFSVVYSDLSLGSVYGLLVSCMSSQPPSFEVQPGERCVPPRPQWFHLRWPVLLVIPGALLIVGAVYGPRQLAQRRALVALEKLGATVRTQPVPLPGVRQLLGDDYAQEIIEIYLRNPKLTDQDLEVLRGLKTLQKLELAGSSVSSQGLACLQGLSNLYTLHLADTKVGDEGLAYLAGLSNLGVLSLDNTAITDAGVSQFARMPQLERLLLSGTGVTDAGLSQLGKLTNLRELSLVGTKITDAGLVHLKGLTKMELLRLYNTKTTPEAMKELHAALPKCVIWVPSE